MAYYHQLSIPCSECGRPSGTMSSPDDHITDQLFCENCSLAQIIEEDPITLRMPGDYPFSFMKDKESACGITIRLGRNTPHPISAIHYRKQA